MARKGSGLRAAIKIVKAIDRVQRQSARQTERERKLKERESAAYRREQAVRKREIERQIKAKALAAEKQKVAIHKAAIEREKSSYEKRVNERANLRKKFIREEIK